MKDEGNALGSWLCLGRFPIYAWKTNGTWGFAFVAALYWILVFFLLAEWHRMPAGRLLKTIFQVFEVYFPLAFAILVAPLFPGELEAGTAELLLSYKVSRFRILLGKLALPFATAVAMFSMTFIATGPCRAAIIAASAHDRSAVSLGGLIGISAPTALFLSGTGVFSSLVGRSTLAGVMSTSGIWLLDFLTGGQHLKWFTLFRQSHPCTCSGIALGPNKVLLALVGVGLYALSWVQLERPERLWK